MPAENRKSIRAERSFDIRHRLSKQNRQRVIEPWIMSKTKDISSSGICFASPVLYQKDDILDIEVMTAGIIEVYKGLAKVVRIQEQWGHYYTALMFIEKKDIVPKKHRYAKKHL